MTFVLSSPAFTNNGDIPRKHTCDGDGVSPVLMWSGTPPNTKSLALIVEDPDAPDPAAPRMTWVHWLLYNLPPTTTGLGEGLHHEGLPRGALEGINSWNRLGYGGPCPPIGRHRYFHKLYALDTVLPEIKSATKEKLESAMQNHILADAVLMGTYEH